MFAKLEITGTVKSETGMHIGGSDAFAAIGAIDSPVVRDVLTNHPMIPGSSLKGKMRSLLARQYSDGKPKKIEEDAPVIQRVFGSTAEKNHPKAARLIFSDLMMTNAEELEKIGVAATEAKFENTINRLTAVANPRQIERSVRGGEFHMDLVYNLEDETEAEEYFQLIHDGMKLLEYDYIGGHGSRGYGKISFHDLGVECVIGEIDEGLLDRLEQIIKEA